MIHNINAIHIKSYQLAVRVRVQDFGIAPWEVQQQSPSSCLRSSTVTMLTIQLFHHKPRGTVVDVEEHQLCTVVTSFVHNAIGALQVIRLGFMNLFIASVNFQTFIAKDCALRQGVKDRCISTSMKLSCRIAQIIWT